MLRQLPLYTRYEYLLLVHRMHRPRCYCCRQMPHVPPFMGALCCSTTAAPRKGCRSTCLRERDPPPLPHVYRWLLADRQFATFSHLVVWDAKYGVTRITPYVPASGRPWHSSTTTAPQTGCRIDVSARARHPLPHACPALMTG